MDPNDYSAVMSSAVQHSIEHVKAGGIPFVGVVLGRCGYVSAFGVNRVYETGDPSAHAEIVAMRAALLDLGQRRLDGYLLLATGEPCGMCYRYASHLGISHVLIAADRDVVAAHGFDYRGSYELLQPDPRTLEGYLSQLDPGNATEPFEVYLSMVKTSPEDAI